MDAFADHSYRRGQYLSIRPVPLNRLKKQALPTVT